MTLSDKDVGKLVRVSKPVEIPSYLPEGSLVLLFNTTDEEVEVKALGTMFISGRPGHKTSAVILPRGLANVLFVSSAEALLSGEVL